ncbi:Immunogenic protein MPT70 precursor [Jannaschia seosinensis]|uniref:Immunogenic protein MPT70 n=1 Tax=Jannaschia seosinensis TaxID=313367 RepID=A0A0M7B807_9RHOB|nr:fasciclin domain-containing protein [Jannaschia seosinensis]CUH24037.1 Immunogenic protein MPT70 precursor [Jannaschia seosinensis]
MTHQTDRRHLLKLAVGAASVAALAACTSAFGEEDLVETAAATGNFTVFTAALEAADLAPTLEGAGPFTLFAPTDAAFAALPEGMLANLLRPENRDRLVAILTGHVAPDYFPAPTLAGTRGRVPTMGWAPLTIDGTGGGINVQGARVVIPDLKASNGVIHGIDSVLLP